MGKVIGIDLGTTNSCVAFIENGEVVVIPNAEGSRTTPSVVSFSREGERRVGSVAKRQATTSPEETIFAVKRLMGQAFNSDVTRRQASLVPYHIVQNSNGDAWVRAGGREFSPPELSAYILQAMRDVAESYLGEEISEAVVTVPAYFDDAQRAATKAAGKIAGLDIKRIINEPTAAALAYGFDQHQGQKIAVYDLGGGTFDISILEISEGVFRVLSTSGDTHLGGEDLDHLLVEELARRFLKQTGIELRGDRIALQRLREQAEKAKHELSTSLETEVNLPFIAADASGPKHLETVLRRTELEVLALDLVERTLEPCVRCLSDAGLTVEDIDEVLLVGGQTRMPLVQRKVTDFFGKQPNKKMNPDEVVAMGAALHAAALSGDISDVLLLDVTPLTLGVETGGGVFHPLILRNARIPTEEFEIFTTSVDNQPFVPVHVLQGERPMAADNKTLAKFELSPIPPAPRGVPEIEVRFSIDANGIVSVAAKDLRSGREQRVNIVASSGLTTDQIEQIVKDAEQYKEDDSIRKEVAELRNAAEMLLYSSESAVREFGNLVPAATVALVQESIGTLRTALAEGHPTDIKDALSRLELDSYKIAEALAGG